MSQAQIAAYAGCMDHDHAAADASVADILDLDAEVVAHFLDELTAWAAGHTKVPVRTIIDVGAGTGSGTLALARRFETAELIAIDRSPTMLERLRTAATTSAAAAATTSAAPSTIKSRLRTVQADLDTAWPPLTTTADLAWASSSLHHVADPDRVLADLHTALNPGGLLVVVEMDAMPRFLPEQAHPGLEERCRAIAARNGWNAWPNWTGHLERAGFTVVEQRVFDIDIRPAPPAANAYAHRVLTGMRNRLAEQLSAGDIAALDRLLDPGKEEFVLRRSDLVVRGARTAWAAHRG